MALGIDAYMDCVNLGPGVAKEVSYAWNFDVDGVIAVIAEADSTRRYEIWHDQQRTFESVRIGLKGQQSSVHNLNTQLRRQAGFLRPSEEAGLRLVLPSVYLELYEIYLDLLPVARLLEGTPKVLSLSLTLIYSDISNRQTKRSFAVTPNVTMWAAGRTDASLQGTSDKPAVSGHVSLIVTEI